MKIKTILLTVAAIFGCVGLVKADVVPILQETPVVGGNCEVQPCEPVQQIAPCEAVEQIAPCEPVQKKAFQKVYYFERRCKFRKFCQDFRLKRDRRVSKKINIRIEREIVR